MVGSTVTEAFPGGLGPSSPGELASPAVIPLGHSRFIWSKDRKGVWDVFFQSVRTQNWHCFVFSQPFIAPFSIHLFPHRAAQQSTSSVLCDTLMEFLSIQTLFIQLLFYLLCLLILCKKYYSLLRQLNWYFSTGFSFKFEHSLSFTPLYREIKGFPEMSMLPDV